MRSHSSQRAVITGIGAITPFAVGWPEIHQAILGPAPQYEAWNPELDPPFESARLGLVKHYPREQYFTDRQLRLMDKAMSLTSVAAAFAMEDAGILVDDAVADSDNVATLLASSRGEAPSLYRFGSPLFKPAVGSVNPAHFPMIARNVACGQVAIRFRLRGWSSTIASGDASGAHALARAAEMITLGRAPAVLVGAYEVLSQISLHQIKARWRKNELTDVVADSPANDYVPVEGACFFVLESQERALARGKEPYATIDGATQGYRFDDSAEGWSRVFERHVSNLPHGRDARRAGRTIHISGAATAARAPAPLQRREQALAQAVARACDAPPTQFSRQTFGDAGALTAMYGVASAAQSLRRPQQMAERHTDDGADRAIVTSLTERGAYSFLSMSA
jgi:3-oxoacyl-(acyl-carrier-protein) synthase